MRRILFIHDSFPGQFGPLARHMQTRGWEVTFATRHPPSRSPGYRIVAYAPHRDPRAGAHPYTQPLDRAVLTGQGFVRAALALRAEGYRPDVIVAHSGWGGGLFARDVFPQAATVAYAEWWYRHPAPDMAFLAALDPRFRHEEPDLPMLQRGRNAPIALDMADADLRLCPTRFQASQFPRLIREGLTIGHDGVDTGFFSPGPVEDPTLGGRVPAGPRLVTYATRGMEPHRGFPQFMAALPAALDAHPDAVAVIAGSNRVAYGGGAIRAIDWKAEAMARADLDPQRVIFTGPLPRPLYRDLLRRSSAHVYLSVPFVLSWSMIEAMAVAPPLVLSDTAPVREFAGEEEAWLTGFAPAAIAGAITQALGGDAAARRRASRERVLAGLSLAEVLPGREAQISAL